MKNRSIDQRQRRAGEEITDVLELAHPRHRIAGPPRLEIGDRQRQQMAEQPRPEFDVDAVGGVREQIGSQAAENGLEQRDGDQPDRPARRASLSERCTSTLSITTWKNSGETSAKICRKNDATSTSPSRRRYLWIAPRNQVMSKRRVMSDNPARRVIRINPPSQIAIVRPRS